NMTQIANTVRERLAAGQLALGMALRQARTVDIGRVLAACGFDFAFIDMEHNTMGVDTAAQIALACHDAGVTPLVRVPGYEHYLATRLLDAGAMGIVFPHVDSPEHARQLVRHCQYPPVAHRSLAGRAAPPASDTASARGWEGSTTTRPWRNTSRSARASSSAAATSPSSWPAARRAPSSSGPSRCRKDPSLDIVK